MYRNVNFGAREPRDGAFWREVYDGIDIEEAGPVRPPIPPLADIPRLFRTRFFYFAFKDKRATYVVPSSRLIRSSYVPAVNPLVDQL